jgi:hypothetical protein
MLDYNVEIYYNMFIAVKDRRCYKIFDAIIF